jgi:hypothetical protein
VAPKFRIWFCIGIFKHRRASGRLRRTVGALAAVVCATLALGAAADPAATAGTVTTGPARSLGEPAAAGDAAVSAVVATTFRPPAAQAVVWTRRAGAAAWVRAGLVQPAGFGTSYDAAAAASPSGPLLVVAGTAPSGAGGCIVGGSVAIANVYASGRLGPARLVSDQRGTGSFDDRPTVAIGQDGTVWVAWSRGPDSGACQDVGTGDRLEVAVSHDGGQTFGAPVTMPADGGHSAFGARLVPLSGGRVAVSWTETTGGGEQAVFVAVLGPGGQLTGPWQVLTGQGPPLQLPGASFYDFPAGDIVALPGGSLVVAAPFWQSGQSVIKLAAGAPGEQWQSSVVSPPGGADLLLPALGALSADGVRMLCAVHIRSGDRLGYDWADLTVTGQGEAAMTTGLTPLTQAPPGPGFHEIGEELSLARTPAGLLTALVVAGSAGATLQTASWQLPAAVSDSAGGTPSASASPSVRPRGESAGSMPGAARPAGAWPVPATGAAVAVIVFAGALVALFWTARRRRAGKNWQRRDWERQVRQRQVGQRQVGQRQVGQRQDWERQDRQRQVGQRQDWERQDRQRQDRQRQDRQRQDWERQSRRGG